MKFVETPIFTRQVEELLTDESYGLLQALLANRPDAGPIMRGSGGLRKLRWKLPGKGKRGGVRTIYYWNCEDTIHMLFIYRKTSQSNLTPAQCKALKAILEEEL